MKLDDLLTLKSIIANYHDFFTSNADGDESGLWEEAQDEINKADEIVDDEIYKTHLRNARGRRKRK